LRANSSPLTINVKRGSARAAAAETRIEAGRVGILRINSFTDGESTEIRTKLQDLLKQGAQKIVLDMRDTAGGSLNEAVAVANLFIKDGVLAQTVGREGKALKSFTADPKATIFTGPVVAMIDTGTAGAAEVVASALMERNRGQVVGEKSFGAGTEQQLFTLRGGDGLLLTTVKWASSSGKTFLGEDRAHSGVTPNVEVKGQEVSESVDPDDLTGNDDDDINKPEQGNEKREVAPAPAAKPASEDLQLKKALELLKDKPAQRAAA
jgi:carboxyl-terminal processing protease